MEEVKVVGYGLDKDFNSYAVLEDGTFSGILPDGKEFITNITPEGFRLTATIVNDKVILANWLKRK